MFERFTDRARMTMALANQEAQRLNHEYIGAEHVLLGLIKEGSGVAADILKTMKIDLRRVRQEVESRIKPGATAPPLTKKSQMPGFMRVIEDAISEARNLGHSVGTEHILLGLMHDDGVAGTVLRSMGLTVEGVREAVKQVPREGGSEPRSTGQESLYSRFTDRARRVMALANQEAQRLQHEYIGTEHVLLALVREGSGTGSNVLRNMNIDLRRVRLEVEKLAKRGPDTVTMSKLPQTPRTKKAIEYAIEEARNLNHNYVGTEHMLLGLIREHDGIAADVLLNLGAGLEDVRAAVLELLGSTTDRSSQYDRAKPTSAVPPRPSPREETEKLRLRVDRLEEEVRDLRKRLEDRE